MKKNNILLLITVLMTSAGLVASAPQSSKITNALLAEQENYVIKSKSFSCVSAQIACPQQNNSNCYNSQRFIAHEIKENSNSFILTLLAKNKELQLKAELEAVNSKNISKNDNIDEYFIEYKALAEEDEQGVCDNNAIDEDLGLQFDMDV